MLGGEVFSFAFRPADGAHRLPLVEPAETPLVTPVTELHWAFYADDEPALRAPWASLAVCPDVVFDDGSRLSEGVHRLGPAIDRYGFPATPSDQFAARWSLPQQWNADSVSLAPWAGRRIAAIEIVLGDDSLIADAAAGDPAAGWVEVVLRQSEEPPGSPAEWVDTFKQTAAGIFSNEWVASVLARFGRGAEPAVDAAKALDAAPLVQPQVEPAPPGLGFTAVAGLALDTMGGLITRFRLAAQPPDVLVTVPTDAAGLLDFHRADELIELGRRLTTEALDAREPEPDEPAASTPEI